MQKMKVIKWFGVCLVLTFICTMHTHLWMYRIPLFFGRSFDLCATVVHSMLMHVTLLLLHSNRSALVRIININNNKPIWARFKMAKVLNAYYVCGCSFILVVVAVIIIVNELVESFFFCFPISISLHFKYWCRICIIRERLQWKRREKKEILGNWVNTTI